MKPILNLLALLTIGLALWLIGNRAPAFNCILLLAVICWANKMETKS
jgi:hypothetical protein